MSNTIVTDLLHDAYDLHIHSAPSPFNRLLDDYELTEQADKAGMAGIVLKSHYESTSARAELVNTHGGYTAKAFGGIVLNQPVGGLNPYAAANALKRGCKIVWMPTRDAANSLISGDMPGDFFKRPGISILDEKGHLKSSVYDILDVVKQYNGTLATGHLSPEESILLCKEGRARDVRMVLTHPEFSRTIVSCETQKELAALGVYIEHCWYNIAGGECSAAQMAFHIKSVGINSCYMTTDRGQNGLEPPVEAMRLFILSLLEQGICEDDIYTMTHTVPKAVLGLN